MKRLGLRERLLLFYALMAITPVGLSGALLYVYLNSQVAHSAEQFQTSVKDDLQRSQRAIRNSAATTLRSSQRQMQQKITRHMDASREQMLQQQKSLLKVTVGALQQTTENALQQTESNTLQSLNRTLSQVDRQVQLVQEQSLASLQETTARHARRAATGHRQPPDPTERAGLASGGESAAQLYSATEPDRPAACDSAG